VIGACASSPSAGTCGASSLRHYVVFAEAARHLSDANVDFDPADQSFWGGIDGYFDTLVRDAAEVLARLAWSPLRARVTLRTDLKKLRTRASEFENPINPIKWRLAGAQKRHGAPSIPHRSSYTFCPT
jgi:hypothetical protein